MSGWGWTVVVLALAVALLAVACRPRRIEHTGPTDRWCPRCGACTCLEFVHLRDAASGDAITSSATCRLHGDDVDHPRAWQ